MSIVGIILEKNGFTKISENGYVNEMCEVTVRESGYDLRYQMDGEWWVMSTLESSIYWLFGVLVWYDLISHPIKK